MPQVAMTHDKQAFKQAILDGYAFDSEAIVLGAAMQQGEPERELYIRLPLQTFNRHGLIAGATGTGKTKTLQVLAEQLSEYGVPSVIMDIKGDLSGIAMPGVENDVITQRHSAIGLPFNAQASPVEFLSVSKEPGVRLRATITELGPILLGKMLGLNHVQQGILAVVFKYCDDHALPLVDLKDLKTVLSYVQTEIKDSFEKSYGAVPAASVGTITRAIVELEHQGADTFFAEPSFDAKQHLPLLRDGKGVISILRVTDIQDRPKLFSTFMLQLLAEIYQHYPEVGDVEKPKLVLFIDEAHLVFDEASSALLDQLETMVKLIRSKGIGLFFVTQNPMDIPEVILSQLGMKIQHALRAFTAKDRKNIKLVAENYPHTDFYDVTALLTELGTGEALVTALDPKGTPTPLAQCYLRAPQSRMGVLTSQELTDLVAGSTLAPQYQTPLDGDSAHERLMAKLDKSHANTDDTTPPLQEPSPKPASRRSGSRQVPKSTLERMLNSTTARQIGRTVARELTRGLLGILGVRRR